MAIALYAGSFDPFHLGHLGLVETATAIFEKVYVAIAGNPDKAGALLPIDARVALIAESTPHLVDVEVVVCTGLVALYARSLGVDVLLRGIGKEQRREFEMAAANEATSGLPTVFLAPAGTTAHLSSSTIRQRFAEHGADAVRDLVPSAVWHELAKSDPRGARR